MSGRLAFATLLWLALSTGCFAPVPRPAITGLSFVKLKAYSLVDMQVPGGGDWIEFMLNIPNDADKQTLGIMNHIALGVLNVRAAANELESKRIELPESPETGRYGKWQLNPYDPDGTRVEFMEFNPIKSPCSPYSAPHPRP